MKNHAMSLLLMAIISCGCQKTNVVQLESDAATRSSEVAASVVDSNNDSSKCQGISGAVNADSTAHVVPVPIETPVAEMAELKTEPKTGSDTDSETESEISLSTKSANSDRLAEFSEESSPDEFRDSASVSESTLDTIPPSVDRPSSELETARQSWNPAVLELESGIANCLAFYALRPENLASRTPWDLMHAALAYGDQTTFMANDKQLNGLQHLFANGKGRNMRLLTRQGDRVVARSGPGFQGHPGQFLAILAQCDVAQTQNLEVGGESFSVQDLIDDEMRTCTPGTELTFKLIAFSKYLDGSTTWKNRYGEWDLTRLLKEELDQNIRGASCGGTHRLTGISYAVKHRRQRAESMTGEWLRAEKMLADYVADVFENQHVDGSFSTRMFNLRENPRDLNQELWVAGHILEWLAYELPDEQLDDPHVTDAVAYLTSLMLEHRDFEFALGKKYHALHGLAMLNGRYFRSELQSLELAEAELPKLKKRSEKVAVTQPSSTQRATVQPAFRPLFRRRFLLR